MASRDRSTETVPCDGGNTDENVEAAKRGYISN